MRLAPLSSALIVLLSLACWVAVASTTAASNPPGPTGLGSLRVIIDDDHQQRSYHVAGVNAEGTSTGYALSSGNAYHGFARHRSGRIEIFDAPGAGRGAGQGTVGQTINDRGEVGGYEVDANNTLHGFLRTRAGAIFVFEAPGGRPAANQGTIVAGPSGKALRPLTGWFYDEDGVVHGWKRAANGAIQVIDAPGPGSALNRGRYTSNEVRYGFVRWVPGAITTFDAAQLATTPGQLTER